MLLPRMLLPRGTLTLRARAGLAEMLERLDTSLYCPQVCSRFCATGGMAVQ
jgi:hypothetical protein